MELYEVAILWNGPDDIDPMGVEVVHCRAAGMGLYDWLSCSTFFSEFENRPEAARLLAVATYFMRLVSMYKIPPELVHEKFMRIDEYRPLLCNDMLGYDNDDFWLYSNNRQRLFPEEAQCS